MISSLIEWPHRSTCHHPSRHNRGEATGTWIPRKIEDIPSIISIQSASNSLIALTHFAARSTRPTKDPADAPRTGSAGAWPNLCGVVAAGVRPAQPALLSYLRGVI